MNLTGKRPRGRPRPRWEKQVRKDVEKEGKTLEKLEKELWDNRDRGRR
jgi:hypothetical protein